MMIDFSTSLLTRKESNIIKGILILLVVIGHNGILMGKAPGLEVVPFNRYLYSFHVYCFFFLPFLYNVPSFTLERIKKDFSHLFRPYLMGVFLLSILFYIQNKTINLSGVLWAILNGSEYVLKQNLGASFLWFIPSMFTLLFFRNLFISLKNKYLYVFFSLSLISFLIFYGFQIIYSLDAGRFLVFGAIPALSYFSIAYIVRFIFEKTINNQRFRRTFICLGILSTLIFFYFDNCDINKYIEQIFSRFFLAISVFLCICVLVKMYSDKVFFRLFEFLGGISMEIYLIHIFIYNALLLLLLKMNVELNFFSGLIVLFVTMFVTLSIVKCTRNTKIYKFIFK